MEVACGGGDGGGGDGDVEVRPGWSREIRGMPSLRYDGAASLEARLRFSRGGGGT